MHSMTQSAIEVLEQGDPRAEKRRLTAHRITGCAQRLTLERGLDGFTMDDLAELAGVSRRTLFNYFPGKDDAVLGGPPVLSAELLETFSTGGPHGHLVDDLAEVVLSILAESPETREDVARGREVMLANPRLIALAHQRLEECVEACMPYIEAREGSPLRPPSRRRGHRAHARVLPPRDAALPRGDGHRSQHLVHRGPRNRPRPSDLTHSTSSAPHRPVRRWCNTPSHRSNPWPPCSTDSARPPTGAGRSSSPAWLVALIGVAALAGAISKPMSRRLLDPGHPVGEGRRPADGAVRRHRRRRRPGRAPPSSSPPRRATRSREPTYADQVDALVADLQAPPADADDATLANPVAGRRRAVRSRPSTAAEQSGTPTATAEANAAGAVAAVARTAGSAPSAGPST